MSLGGFHDQSPFGNDRKSTRIPRGGYVRNRKHAAREMAYAVVVAVQKEQTIVSTEPVNRYIQHAELTVHCEALYPRSHL